MAFELTRDIRGEDELRDITDAIICAEYRTAVTFGARTRETIIVVLVAVAVVSTAARTAVVRGSACGYGI